MCVRVMPRAESAGLWSEELLGEVGYVMAGWLAGWLVHMGPFGHPEASAWPASWPAAVLSRRRERREAAEQATCSVQLHVLYTACSVRTGTLAHWHTLDQLDGVSASQRIIVAYKVLKTSCYFLHTYMYLTVLQSKEGGAGWRASAVTSVDAKSGFASLLRVTSFRFRPWLWLVEHGQGDI